MTAAATRSPRRSLLMTPADDERLVPKAFTAGADAIWFDLEDAVPAERKDTARAEIPSLIARHRTVFRGETLVRVNGLADGGADDLAALAGAQIDGIVLPKVESADDVITAAAIVRSWPADREVAIWAMIETLRAVVDAEAIAASSPALTALIFGGGEIAQALGTHAGPTGRDEPLAYARSRTLLAARVYDLSAIDSSYPDVHDAHETARAAERSFLLGYDGMLAASPRQIRPIHEAWAPTAVEREHAERVLGGADATAAVLPEAVRVDAQRVLSRAVVARDISMEVTT